MDVVRKTPLIELLRSLRWRVRAGRRRASRDQEYPEVSTDVLPIVFGNAMAKSGSHLLAQFLEGIASISPFVFTAEQPVRTITPEGRHRPDWRVVKDLERLLPGDIGWGYIPARAPFDRVLTGEKWITYFIYRDPRDKIVSHIFFAMDIHPEHAMRDYYRSLPSMETRIEATINGVPGLLGGIDEAYASYRGWLLSPEIIKVRFEDLILEREETLENMVAPLFDRVFAKHITKVDLFSQLNERMSPERSRTFRSGTTGEWRDYFTPANIEQFKRVAGDLLIEMGYEHDDAWT